MTEYVAGGGRLRSHNQRVSFSLQKGQPLLEWFTGGAVCFLKYQKISWDELCSMGRMLLLHVTRGSDVSEGGGYDERWTNAPLPNAFSGFSQGA